MRPPQRAAISPCFSPSKAASHTFSVEHTFRFCKRFFPCKRNETGFWDSFGINSPISPFFAPIPSRRQRFSPHKRAKTGSCGTRGGSGRDLTKPGKGGTIPKASEGCGSAKAGNGTARKVRASQDRVPANGRRRRLQGQCNRKKPQRKL